MYVIIFYGEVLFFFGLFLFKLFENIHKFAYKTLSFDKKIIFLFFLKLLTRLKLPSIIYYNHIMTLKNDIKFFIQFFVVLE